MAREAATGMKDSEASDGTVPTMLEASPFPVQQVLSFIPPFEFCTGSKDHRQEAEPLRRVQRA